MKYYRLTLLKDLPGLKAGRSIIINENKGIQTTDDYPEDWGECRERLENERAIIKIQDNTEFVKKELAEEYAIKEIDCPVCGKHQLYPLEERYHVPGDGIYIIYASVGIKCENCGFETHIKDVKIDVRYY